MQDATSAWLHATRLVMGQGELVAPRNQLTREIQQQTHILWMRKPVVRVPIRALNHRFMAAEAYWILSGDDSVAGIVAYNSKIAEFSDDGQYFFGAYGPKVVDQLPYMIEKLKSDRDTRQAGLTIWREKPPATRDVPCTVAVFASIRSELLHLHVFMRSSDLWLGLPYDVFNFSMLGHLICATLTEADGPKVTPGKLYLTAASSHLYERDWDKVARCQEGLPQPTTPEALFTDSDALMERLEALRHVSPGSRLRWWEQES
jgi:thymidylate synthase